jgi:transposase
MDDEILSSMDDELNSLYAESGRPSIAPEYLLRASILRLPHSIRSERRLMIQIDLNILFPWFVGLSLDYAAWEHSTFTVDGTLIEAWASMKSFQEKGSGDGPGGEGGRNPEADFHGETRPDTASAARAAWYL